MRAAIVVAVACLSVVGVSAGQDAKASIKKSTSIPAQALVSALKTLARERGFQVVFQSELVGTKRTQGAVGEFTTAEALTKLLDGTDLVYSYLDEKTVTITSAGTKLENSESNSNSTSDNKEDVQKKLFWDRLRVAQVDQGISAVGSPPHSQAVSGDADGGQKIEEIVVTAQKREEKLQDVPISISVLTGAQLDRSTDQGLSETLNRLPGVTATVAQFGGTQLAIRGVTASAAAFAGSSPIGYYLDSVPFGLTSTAAVPDANPYDAERVEVLRGPQGTLYGASALNGVVRVLTQDPNLYDFAMKMRGSTSSTYTGGESYRGDLAVNVPIVEGKLAARAVVSYQDLSGWLDSPSKKDVNDGQIRTARIKVAAQPIDELSIVASAWSSRADYGGPSFSTDGHHTNSPLDQPISTDYNLYGLKVGYDFSAFSVNSATGYLNYSNGNVLDVGLPIGLDSRFGATVLSEEINLTSNREGAWRWTAGGIYRHGKDTIWQDAPGILAAPGASNYDSKSYALFGELTRLFLDGQWELTGGLRYFEDRQTSTETWVLTGAPPAGLYDRSTFNATTPRAILTWHPSEGMTTYTSYSQGFRSGFSQTSTVAALGFPDVKPDKLTNYELGAKGSLWDRRLSYEAAVYYTDWKGVQQQLAVLVQPPSVYAAAGVNSGSASGPGIDFMTSLEIARGLTLGANFSWNGLTLDSDVLSMGSILFQKGDRLNRSSEYTGGVSADSVFPLGGSGFNGRLSVSVNYTSQQERRTLTFLEEGNSMLISRASFAIEPRDSRWSATLYADNINNEQGSVIDSRELGTPDMKLRPRPRTIGVQLEYRL